MSSESYQGSVRFHVRVIPRAPREEFGGIRGEAVVVRLTAPPVDNVANKALLEMLSKALDVPACDLSIVAGQRNRDKTVRVAGLSLAKLKQRLQQAGVL